MELLARAIEIGFTIALVVALLLIYKLGVPQRRGYFCNDPSISYPFRSSTVPSWWVFVFGPGICFVTVCVVEWLRFSRRALTTKRVSPSTGRLRPLTVAIYRCAGSLLFGGLVTLLLTNIGKFTVGRLRPNFLAVCNSNVTNCSSDQYVSEYTCQTDEDTVQESRLSFPSGHSSGSFYAMVFFVVYVQYRCRWCRFGRAVAQLVALCVAWYVALTRIADYKHHPTDVLAGSLLGTLVATLTLFVLCRIHLGDRSGDAVDDTAADGAAAGRSCELAVTSVSPDRDQFTDVNLS